MDADSTVLGLMRGSGTLVLFVAFAVYCVWVWLPGQRQRFHDASMLPFIDERGSASREKGERGSASREKGERGSASREKGERGGAKPERAQHRESAGGEKSR